MKNETFSRTDKKRIKKDLKKASYVLNSQKEADRSKEKRNRIIFGILAAVAVALAIFFEGFLKIDKEISDAVLICLRLCLLMLGMAVVIMAVRIYDLFTGRISQFFHRYKKTVLICTTLLLFGAITFLCLNPKIIFPDYSASVDKFIKALETKLKPSELFSYYTAQLSLTFISISVMSVLSDKSVIIYWSNVSEDRLIEPTFTCFAAYTYYSIAATIGAGLGVILEQSLLFTIFFILNVLALIMLTLSVTDVYYGRDTKKKKLASKLRKIHNNALSNGYHLEKYNSTMLAFSKNIYIAAQNGDLPYLQEVYELVVTEPEIFENPTRYYTENKLDITKGRDVIEALISTLDDSTFSIFIQSMETTLEVQRSAINRYEFELEQGAGVMANCTLEPDSQFWEVLSENEYFLNRISTVPKTDREFMKQKRLIQWIADRIKLDYRQNAALYRANHPDEKLDYENPDWETTEKVMEYAFAETNTQDERLFLSFAKLLCAIFEKDIMVEHFIGLFDDPPYVYYLLDQIEFFEVQDELREKMNRIFRKHHPDAALRKSPKWAPKQ